MLNQVKHNRHSPYSHKLKPCLIVPIYEMLFPMEYPELFSNFNHRLKKFLFKLKHHLMNETGNPIRFINGSIERYTFRSTTSFVFKPVSVSFIIIETSI